MVKGFLGVFDASGEIERNCNTKRKECKWKIPKDIPALKSSIFLDREHNFLKIVTSFCGFFISYLVKSNMHVAFTN